MTIEWQRLRPGHEGCYATLQAGGMAAPGMQGIGSGTVPPAGFPMPGGMGMAGMPGVDLQSLLRSTCQHSPSSGKGVCAHANCRLAAGS